MSWVFQPLLPATPLLGAWDGTGGIKVYNGATWVWKPVLYYNGAAFVRKDVYRWTGTEWRKTNT